MIKNKLLTALIVITIIYAIDMVFFMPNRLKSGYWKNIYGYCRMAVWEVEEDVTVKGCVIYWKQQPMLRAHGCVYKFLLVSSPNWTEWGIYVNKIGE